MSTLSHRHTALSPHASRSRPGLLDRIVAVAARHRQRRALAQLDTRLLDDVGLDRADIAAELARPLWDAPDHWRR